MKVKEVIARIILDSRKEKTIEVSVKTENGLFSSSAPSGKSKGKNEASAYVKSPEEDALTLINLNKKIQEINFEKFSDLELVEEKVRGIIGANPLYALETSMLKALALEQGKQLWQILNPRARRFPHPVGNCIGGGLHSTGIKGLKPDFQEYLIIPRAKKFADNVFLMNKAWESAGKILKMRGSCSGVNDENAWNTGLNNDEALDVLNSARNELQGEKVDIGMDIASTSFYSNKFYGYKNAFKKIGSFDQKYYVKDLAKNYGVLYLEDPLQEEDFEGFAELRRELSEEKPTLVVGDDLICSNLERLKKALMEKSVNSIIVKPNQVGSLVDIAKLVALAKKYEVVTVMSHRSGETMDYALADFAFAFQTEFIKTGIKGKEREIKLNRMIEIEKSLQ
jgi:enolase